MSEDQTMLAALFHGRGDIRISEVPIPAPGDDEILLRVATAGICGTDAHEFASGPHMFPGGSNGAPFIPGHEFSGHVVATGASVSGFEVGTLVTSGAGISCGVCQWCKRGRTNLCEKYRTIGLQLQGGLAQYAVVPSGICLAAGPLGLSPDIASMAQPMSVAVHAMRRGRLKADDVAVIIGAGGIGAFLTYAAGQSGAETTVLDIDETRLEIATALGATRVIRAGSGAEGILGPHMPIVTVIYEVTGTSAGLRLALELAQPGTRIVLVGIQGGLSDLDLRKLTLRELEIIGTNAHSFAFDFPESLRLLASRAVGWKDLAPVAVPLHDLVEDGLTPIVEGRAKRIKTLIDPWADMVRSTS